MHRHTAHLQSPATAIRLVAVLLCTGVGCSSRPAPCTPKKCRTSPDQRALCDPAETCRATADCERARRQGNDPDGDGIPEPLELALARHYFPEMTMHCGTYEGVEHGSYGQFYGGGALTRDVEHARLPFVARWYSQPGWVLCRGPRDCIEIVYGMAFSWDLGDDVLGLSHRGDSEMYAVLLVRTGDSTGDPANWRLHAHFTSAHMCAAPSDDSAFAFLDESGESRPMTVYVTEGKNALYHSADACQRGGFWNMDDCSEHRCRIDRPAATARLQNAGEYPCPSGAGPVRATGRSIARPARQRRGAPTGSYDVWSGEEFGRAAPFLDKLRPGTLRWHERRYMCW